MIATLPRERDVCCVVLLAITLLFTPACGSTDGDSDAAPAGCSADSDCARYDDDNLCNGTLVCDAESGVCHVGKTTIVSCAADKDTPCATNACEAKTGKCAMTPTPAGTVCDDGDPCTGGDKCADGKCASGAVKLCHCKDTKDCAGDGDKCKGASFCDKAVVPWTCRVKPGSVVTCNKDEGPCRSSQCDPKTGKCEAKNGPDDKLCNDGNKCTADDVCAAGKCTGIDICTCKKTADCAKQEDGNSCNGVLFCDQAKGTCRVNPTTIITCSTDKDTACVKNQCDPNNGLCRLSATPKGTKCDDDNACTAGDNCVGGECLHSKNVCVCKKNADCDKHDDGNKCNGLQFCDKSSGTCKANPASVVTCQGVLDSACSLNACQPSTGKCEQTARADVKQLCEQATDAKGKPIQVCKWVVKKKGEAGDKGPFLCDDANLCTEAEHCEGKTCGGGKKTCECTNDSDCESKDDGNACNGVYFCNKSKKSPVCEFNPASKVFCSPTNDTACLKAACDPKSGKCGLQPAPGGTKCEDGNPCTTKSTCKLGKCQGGVPKVCDDKDVCTEDSCDGGSGGKVGAGCVFKARNCDDGNACTADSCGKTGKCDNKPQPVDSACNADNNPCTVADRCDAKAVCSPGAKKVCDSSTAGPCEAAICQPSGPHAGKCAVIAKNDGDPCTGADPCYAGSACKAAKCVLGTKSTLWTRTADGMKSTDWTAVKAVTGGDIIAAGQHDTGEATKWRAIRYDLAGIKVWTQTILPAKGVKGLGDVLLVDGDADETVLVGGFTKSDGTQSAGFGRISADGKLTSFVPVAWKTKDNHELQQAARHTSGNYVLGARYTTANGSKGRRYALVRKTGQTIWESAFGSSETHRISDLAVLGDGRILARGFLSKTGKPPFGRTFGSLLSPAGARLDSTNVNYGTAQYTDHKRIAVVGGGVLVLFGYVNGGINVRLTPANSMQSYGTNVTSGKFWVVDQKSRQGRVFLVTRDTNGEYSLRTLDRFGNPSTPRSIAIPEGAVLRALDVTADGSRVAVAGTLGTGVSRRPIAFALDQWGSGSCKARGACAKLSRADCDDGSACTADGCSAASGCESLSKAGRRCDAADGCSFLGNCNGTKCESARYGRRFLLRWKTTSTPHELEAIGAIEHKPGMFYGYSVKQSANDARIQRYRIDMAVGGATENKSITCKDFSAGAHVARSPSDAVYINGVSKSSDSKGGLAKCRISTSSVLVTRYAVPGCSTCTAAARDMDFYSGGNAVLLGEVNTPKTGWAVMVAGVVIKNDAQLMHKTGVSTAGYGIEVRHDGSLLIVGRETKAGTYAGKALIIGAAYNGVQTYRETPANLIDPFLADAVDVPKGDAVVAGYERLSKEARRSLVFGVDQKGKVTWVRRNATTDSVYVRGLTVLADNTIVHSGTHAAGANRIVLTGLAGNGERLWRHDYRYSGTGGVSAGDRSIVQLSTGEIVVPGKRSLSGTPGSEPLWLVADPWGHAGCKVAGKCTNLNANECDDQKVCTSDYCDASFGCKNVVIAGLPCDDGQKCTASETCNNSGSCGGGKAVCGCIKDADCADDGDACNGTPEYDNGTCRVKKGSAVVCSTANDGACEVTSCDPATAKCVKKAKNAGTDCSDGGTVRPRARARSANASRACRRNATTAIRARRTPATSPMAPVCSSPPQTEASACRWARVNRGAASTRPSTRCMSAAAASTWAATPRSIFSAEAMRARSTKSWCPAIGSSATWSQSTRGPSA